MYSPANPPPNSTGPRMFIVELIIAAIIVATGVLVARGPWLRLGLRNWQVKRVRTTGAILAIALGTGAVVWVSCCYESVRRTVMTWAAGYVGSSHVSVQSSWGKYDTLPQRLVNKVENLSIKIPISDTKPRQFRELQPIKYVAPLLVQRMPAAALPAEEYDQTTDHRAFRPTMDDLDVNGIDPDREFKVRDWERRLVAGRMIGPDDDYACVLEQSVAEEEHVGVGDMLLIWGYDDSEPVALKIVGVIERRRIARFLKGVALVRLPILQQICARPGLINSLDIVLKEPTQAMLMHTGRGIQNAVRGTAPNILVRSAAARQKHIEQAQSQQQAVLILLSCVAMLTALFIILSTLSMGMVERVTQLGLLRCVGATRAQLVALTLAEVLPLGIIGVLLGVPIGLGLTALSVWFVPDYVGSFTINANGISLAVLAGLITSLVGGLLPALAATTVTPLEATRPRARRAGPLPMITALLIAAGALVAQVIIMQRYIQRDLNFIQFAIAAVVLLYAVYALVAPLLVWVASRIVVPTTALLVRVRLRLLQDQVGHAAWRSAGIVCGLMVGLSLIVALVVFNQSFRTGWQFPKQFPEAYLWSYEQITGPVAETLEQTPGVKKATVANAVNVIVEERPIFGEEILRSFTWFLGIEPDSFLKLVRMEFIEGDEQTARELLRQGGHVIVAADFARTRKKGVEEVRDAEGRVIIGNTVRVWFNNRWETFKIAGVIDSPALDIAANYFQVESESHVAAVGSVIGTNADLQRLYNIDGAKLVLLNFNLPDESPPADWPPPLGTPAARSLSHKSYDTSLSLERRWENYREIQVLQRVKRHIHAPQAFYGTARELKDEIDAELTNMTRLLSMVPSVALLVAAIGVANLMTANVASRTRQLAVMRAVGATRGLVLRLVMGEALVLGLLGSAMGLGLGMHLAWNITIMTARMWGYAIDVSVPWDIVGAAIALTVGLCILAGIGPARHASRTNVIAALHVA